jgi:hypothetical protein
MRVTTPDQFDEESTGAEAMLERLLTSASGRNDAEHAGWPTGNARDSGRRASRGRR